MESTSSVGKLRVTIQNLSTGKSLRLDLAAFAGAAAVGLGVASRTSATCTDVRTEIAKMRKQLK
eukprot:1187507-Amphidinium_carterae.1